MEYTPDKWVVLKITEISTNSVIYKILSGWSGGYLSGDSWRLSSGITEIVEDRGTLLITNESGSKYFCYEGTEGVNLMSAGILDKLRKSTKHIIDVVPFNGVCLLDLE